MGIRRENHQPSEEKIVSDKVSYNNYLEHYKRANLRDPLDVLWLRKPESGITPQYVQREITPRYRSLLKLFHPDTTPVPDGQLNAEILEKLIKAHTRLTELVQQANDENLQLERIKFENSLKDLIDLIQRNNTTINQLVEMVQQIISMHKPLGLERAAIAEGAQITWNELFLALSYFYANPRSPQEYFFNEAVDHLARIPDTYGLWNFMASRLKQVDSQWNGVVSQANARRNSL